MARFGDFEALEVGFEMMFFEEVLVFWKRRGEETESRIC